MKPRSVRSLQKSPLGVGVGLRHPHVDRIVAERPAMPWFEFTPENYMNRGGWHRRGLRQVAENYPMVAHGVGTSLGSPRLPTTAFLNELREVVRETGALWASDHLCYTVADGQSMNELIPLPFTEEAVKTVAANVKRVRDHIGIPWLVENISYYAVVDDTTMDEAEFITAVLKEADCGLLLDINNVHVNAMNHGFDARAFIARLPLERVVQIHLAGHDDSGEVIIDTHGAPVPSPVWKLFEDTLPKLPPCSVLIEWDNNIPTWERLVREADHAERVMSRVAKRAVAAPA